VHVSIDTRHADVARACVDVGAVIVNDVSGGRGDAAMWPYIAESGVTYVLMHNRGDGIARPELATYGRPARWESVTAPVWGELDATVEDAFFAGIRPDQLVLDPGIGFAKSASLSWSLARENPYEQWQGLEHLDAPVLLGASRKRFLARWRFGLKRFNDSMEQRDRLTVQLTERAARHGIWCVRVHDVAPNAEVVRRVRADGWMES
jgi:dihydropteroate synthase